MDTTSVTRFFWRVNSQSSTAQQNVIKTYWPELPDNVDAAYESGENYNVYIFKGRPKDSKGTKPFVALLNTVKKCDDVIFRSCCKSVFLRLYR